MLILKRELINIGLGEKKETVKLYEVNENNPGMNRIITDDRNFPFSKININTLDFILEDLKISKVDFIKIDTEQYELQVVTGGIKTIKKHRPTIFFENKRGEANQVILLLLDLGFTVRKWKSDTIAYYTD